MRLNVHVGHGKTGSSFLQSWWAINAEVLRHRHGIAYPLVAPRSGRREDAGMRGVFSMGNGFILEEVLAEPDPAAWLAQLAAGLPSGGQLLFSCERFVRSLPGQLLRLEEVAVAAGFSSVRLLLFVRDPLAHAHSLYAEMVKAHGYTGTVEDWLLLYNLHEAIEHFLEVQALGPTLQLTAFNYSLAPTQLRKQARGWLDIPGDAPFADPPSALVNRSLDQQELRALLVLNRLLGTEGRGIGRRLVRELPDLPARATVAAPEAQIRFLKRVTAAVARINAFLPPDQALRLQSLPRHDQPGDGSIRLMPDQLEVIAAELLTLGATGVQARSPLQPSP
jgi:hypothetical protein